MREASPERPVGAACRGGAGERSRPEAAGGACSDQRAGSARRSPAGVRAAGCGCRESGVRARVTVAEERGGFVLLVGGSSAGKTRSAVEAVKALLPDWWLVHPAGPDQVAALAAAPPSRTVVWLDELQRYLDGEHGLTGAVVRALLNAPHPAVIIGTMWPDLYAAYTAMPAVGRPDPHAREREVLDLAVVVRIGVAFSPAEQDRARATAAQDPRLRVALKSAGYGLTQTLAAAPQLVARWEDAKSVDPYAWAVLTAALDTARLGARAPLSVGLLRAAAPGYCTSQQQAEAPDNWFEQAIAYVTGKLHGAAAALSPAGTGMGRLAGYSVADYLVQHASRERRSDHVPASTWAALLTHIRDPADTARLADSARNRLLYCYAVPLYWRAADAGDEAAAVRLGELLAGRGDVDGLRARADAGDKAAAWQLARLLADRGDLGELRARAEAGDEDAAVWLGEHFDLGGLRARADAGDEDAARYLAVRLARLLAGRGDVDGLRARADAGDEAAAWRLVRLLADRGDLGGLRARADVGDEDAAWQLAKLRAERGDPDGAAQILRARAGDGDGEASLGRLLADGGDVDGLRARAAAGDKDAAWRLAKLLAECGDPDGLRARADAGDEDAAWRLAMLLAGRGDVGGLRARADAGDGFAASELAKMPGERFDLDGLRARADAGDRFAASELARLLADRGDLDGAAQILRASAEADDRFAASELARLLADRGDPDGAAQILRARAEAGDADAAVLLARLLVDRGDPDGAAQILRASAEAGDGFAASELARLLADRGDPDGAAQILRASADAGDVLAAWELAMLLAERGDLDGLRARAHAGDAAAAQKLPELLIKQGRNEEAEQLRRFGLNPDGSIACA